ncbi:hypothetical protein [Bacteroides sp. ET71]|nr:hypothetical protein [Bacteroides sp. ET71]
MPRVFGRCFDFAQHDREQDEGDDDEVIAGLLHRVLQGFGRGL